MIGWILAAVIIDDIGIIEDLRRKLEQQEKDIETARTDLKNARYQSQIEEGQKSHEGN